MRLGRLGAWPCERADKHLYRSLYFLLGLCSLAPGIVAFWLRRDLRPNVLSVGIFGLVWGPISEYWFSKDYWHPPSIIGHPWLEDAIYGAGISITGSVIYKLLLRQTHRRDPTAKTGRLLLVEFPLVYVLAMTVFQSCLHVNSIIVSVGVYVVLTVLILVRRPDLVKASVTSALILGLLALAGYAVGLDWLVNGRDFLEQTWLLYGEPLGKTVLGQVPLTEVLWYTGWGLLLGAGYEYVTGLRLVNRRDRPAAATGTTPASRGST